VKWLLVLLAAAALVFAGFAVCHVIGQKQADAAAVIAAHDAHVRDSVERDLRSTIFKNQTTASTDSILGVALLVQQKIDHQTVAQATAKAVAAQAQLDTMKSAVDSLRAYRSELVPALQSEVKGLTAELATSDSGRTISLDGWQHQRQMTAALETMHATDSARIRTDSIALAKKSAVVALPKLTTWGNLGYAAETAAFGFVTVKACADHLISLQCLVGSAVTARRLVPRKG
jgi:hypothetical protein